mgnify:CR=1 FL=1|tara:strand:- start:159 stop:599 length:441 start_codon:yes stop_codon:yes gene_type:complete
MPCANNTEIPCAFVEMTDNEQCMCCSNEKTTPNDFYEFEGKIYFSVDQLCQKCVEHFMSIDGQFELYKILKIREGATCSVCHKPLPEEQHGLGPGSHFDCIKSNVFHKPKIKQSKKIIETNKSFNYSNSKFNIYYKSNMWCAEKIK